ncbi:MULTISPECIES: hypothetical protein [Leptotrichia]|uniref:hypothetical protein n=1 Tax=Leptotrichia TaxID=32067 RepID=UPI0015C11C87|nr:MULTISPECIES: hypothetical protein [Leptotrichia]NWO27838.1 hypothetical protein [Leptotrichia sp. oral taxon 417]DAR96248.1 MAG TPA: hypothetical protein [Caudoviricetes sp.]
MGKQKYILNNTYGINGIEKISLKEIMKIFSVPEEIEMKLSDDKITISIDLIYKGLKIYYSLSYFVENLTKPETQFLTFCMEKLYLNNRESIKVGDEIKTVLPKIRKYLKRNNKNVKFEYEEDKYAGRYLFDNGEIDIFFEKFGSKKVMDGIMISLPYEDILPENKEVLAEISKIMEIKNKIDGLFWEKYKRVD